MSNKCWDINLNCMAKATGNAYRPCPAFELKKSCWELEWEPFLQKLSAVQKETMGKLMKENCPKCPVYDSHQKKIDQKLKLFVS